jgi:hypothetical protein
MQLVQSRPDVRLHRLSTPSMPMSIDSFEEDINLPFFAAARPIIIELATVCMNVQGTALFICIVPMRRSWQRRTPAIT